MLSFILCLIEPRVTCTDHSIATHLSGYRNLWRGLATSSQSNRFEACKEATCSGLLSQASKPCYRFSPFNCRQAFQTCVKCAGTGNDIFVDNPHLSLDGWHIAVRVQLSHIERAYVAIRFQSLHVSKWTSASFERAKFMTFI